MHPYRPISGIRWEEGTGRRVEDSLVSEAQVGLSVNGEEWLTLLCSPHDVLDLALGFLFNQGVISSQDEVAAAHLGAGGRAADIWLTHAASMPRERRRISGCGGEAPAAPELEPAPHKGQLCTPQDVLHLMGELYARQEVHRLSGGTHASALCSAQEILAYAEDIGRHNTLDRLAGRRLQGGLPAGPYLLLTTGRISSEMVQKTLHMGASLAASHTTPTDLAVEWARQSGLTLCGYARAGRLTVYAHPQRLGMPGLDER